MKKYLRTLLTSASLLLGGVVLAQTDDGTVVPVADGAKKSGYPIHVSGSVQSDILIPQKDEKIGAKDSDEWALTNTYAEVNAQSE